MDARTLLVTVAASLATSFALTDVAQAPVQSAARFAPPEDKDIPTGPIGEAVRYGQKLVTQTQKHAKPYIGNGLNCTTCHLNGGKTPYASPWVGLWGVFPEYRSRNSKVNAVQERINDCFQRSMNGKPLPIESDE